MAADAQEPRRLGKPLRRVAPDRGAVLRDREVERIARQARLLGVRLHELEPEAELGIHAPRRIELRRSHVDADDPPRAALLQPGAEVGRAAAELDDVFARDVGQRVDVATRVPRRRPHVISSCAHASWARASVCSSFAFVQARRLTSTYSGSDKAVGKPERDLARGGLGASPTRARGCPASPTQSRRESSPAPRLPGSSRRSSSAPSRRRPHLRARRRASAPR